jgi:hypothetical protein
MQGMSDSIRREFGYTPTHPTISSRSAAAVHPRFVGSPRDVTDGTAEWFLTRACDGFVVASHVSRAYAEFSRLLVPELQRPSRFHTVYVGTTLRENLGLNRSGRGAACAWSIPIAAVSIARCHAGDTVEVVRRVGCP